jgi:large subunit ribosomal protein L25
MEKFVLQALNRTKSTKGELNKYRHEGKIPAVVYGGGKESVNLFVYRSEYEKALKSITESTIIALDVEGKKLKVFVKEHQRSAVEKDLLHIDFLEVQEGKVLHAHVRIFIHGTPVGVVAGGVLENPTHEIEVACDPAFLPERINIDVTSLEVNHAIHVRDLPVMENVKVLTNGDTVVAAVKYAKKEVEPVVEAAEAAVTAEGGAEGEAEAGAEAPAGTEAKAETKTKAKAPEAKA